VTAVEFQERWKNIRAIFVRNMKPAKTKRTYYLMESMQFTVPYIKALGATSGNLPSPPEQEDKESEENDSTANEENVLEPQCSFQQPPTSSLPYPSSPLPSPTALHTTEIFQSKKNTPTVSLSLFHQIYQTENVALRTQLIKHSSNTSKPKEPER